MKKIILFATTVFVFVACKKSGSDTPIPINTIEANINGTDYTFNKKILDTILVLPAEDFIPFLQLRASIDASANSKAFEIDLVSDNFDSTKSYASLNSVYKNDNGYVDYFPDTTHIFTYGYTQPTQTNNPVTITITAVTS